MTKCKLKCFQKLNTNFLYLIQLIDVNPQNLVNIGGENVFVYFISFSLPTPAGRQRNK